jgi:flavin-dependent dehydrogenase
MSDTDGYDIIIVGAGPAGISTALHLAQTAPELVGCTLILEKARHPRPKLCAGGLLPDAEVILRALGLDVSEIPHLDVKWARFQYAGKGKRMRAEKRGKRAFRTIRRHEFDAWLADKAREHGFAIRENTAVMETDQGEYNATIVVGADGSNSIVRRAIIPIEKTHTARLLEIVSEPRPSHAETEAYFDFRYIPRNIPGYTWDFPAIEKGQTVRVRGIYDSNVHTAKRELALREALSEDFARQGLNLADYKLEGFPLHWFEAKSIFATPHIILAGDAAGADVLFGEGISIALGYGDLAARAVRDAFASQDFSFREYKNHILNSQMGKALRLRAWFARLLYGLRWGPIQMLMFHWMGPLLEWLVQTFLIDWARREQKHKG